MDPNMLSSAFASIVALIGQYRNESRESSQNDFNEFIEWLIKTQHEDIKNLLMANTKATIGVKALLKEEREEIISKIECLNGALVSFASGVSGFAELAEAISPNSILSNQAIGILSAYESKNASRLLSRRFGNVIILQFLDGNGGQVEISDERFLDDDLRSLVELRLLREDFNSSGDSIYVYTRAAAALLKSINVHT